MSTLESLRRRVRTMEQKAGIGSLKTVVDILIRDEYRVAYEQRQHTTYVHVQVRKWNARVARRFAEDIDTAHELLGKPIYALDDPNNLLLRKFLTLHGFKPHSQTTDVFGRAVTLFERQAPNGRRNHINQHGHQE